MLKVLKILKMSDTFVRNYRIYVADIYQRYISCQPW